MDTKKIIWSSAVIGALLVAVFALALPYGARITLGIKIFENPTVHLTVLAVFSVIALISALALLAYIFAALRLTDTRYALALPQGSVRALIALSLIVIFVISAVFLFTTLATEGRTGPIEIGADRANEIPLEELFSKVKVPVLKPAEADEEEAAGTDEEEADETDKPAKADEETFIVVLRLPTSHDARDFAKQIFTTISTLVIAMAGFYFGSRTVARARGIVEQATLRILSPDPGGEPVKMKRVDANPLDIKLRVTPDGAAVRWDRHPPGDLKGELNQMEPTHFRYTRGDDQTIAEKVTLTFALVDHPDVSAALDIGAPPDGGAAVPGAKVKNDQAQIQLNELTAFKFLKDAAGDKLQAFWMPDRKTPDPNNTKALKAEMVKHGLETGPGRIVNFITGAPFADLREKVVKDLGL